MNLTRHHADWLSLIEVSGPFVSLPVLLRVFPDGLEPRDPEKARALRDAWEDWLSQPGNPAVHRQWISHVLAELLGYSPQLLREGQSMPPGLEAAMPVQGELLRPDFALVEPLGRTDAGAPRLLIAVHPATQSLDKPLAERRWKATPATRMMELLHATNVPLGLVTNGGQWMLVFAPRGETTGFASWYAELWMDEHVTLRAFHSLLGVRRFFGVADGDTLAGMLTASSEDQHEVADQLGMQVREAVEVLVQCLDALDRESHGTLLHGVSESHLYNAALTVMMRLVFLFSAEERGLLHLGEPLYDENYALSTLRDQLQEIADQHGEEVLERRHDAWARLLATFRAVHGGIEHQDLMMQAYGGSLFDPDQYPFLEGRPAGGSWRHEQAEPLAVDNRVVLHLLNSLQRLRIRLPGAGQAETRRVSFRALDVEQIGTVYEGLLDHTAVRASSPVLGLRGAKGRQPMIPLARLEALRDKGGSALPEFLRDETGRSLKSLENALMQESIADEHALRIACGQDAALHARVRPFAALLREDSFGRPLVVPDGGMHIATGNLRRSTGTHYTPPSLTGPIVTHTLEPLVFEGPAEGLPPERWTLKPPAALLDLRICDMAMGSGAFLVQACRYLADRLVEAWEAVEEAHPGEVLISPEGGLSHGAPTERLLPGDAAERVAIARRFVADRCLHGVDINPMAVEMAKLSMWLVTVDRDRPFTFLDHAFLCGDSLMGITSIDQLRRFSLRPGLGGQLTLAMPTMEAEIGGALRARMALEALPSDTPAQVAAKAALLAEARDAVSTLHAVADVLVAFELQGWTGRAWEQQRTAVIEEITEQMALGRDALLEYAGEQLESRRCLHWALVFPEIMNRGGFDAFVGNPPFVGGKKISGFVGKEYREFLVDVIGRGVKGNADLCAYFFLRVGELSRDDGMAGLVATNTIAQGDTREVGLDQIVAVGCTIPRAMPSAPWPGEAALEVAHVWLRKGGWKGPHILQDAEVAGITPMLTLPGRLQGKPFRLKENEGKSFQGSIVLGMGFVLTPEEAGALIARDPRNRDCLFPYLNGEDLNSRPDQSASRWVINFHDWPLAREADGSWNDTDANQRKEFMRSGIVPRDYPDPVAEDYPELLQIVESKVKPERVRRNAKGDFVLRYPLFHKWWIYADKRPELYATIAGMERVLVVPLVTKHFGVAVISLKVVYSHALGVVANSSYSCLAIIQSTIHDQWARTQGSSLETRMRYTPSDCLETYPFPSSDSKLDSIGERYYNHRQSIMRSRHEGLTKTYNRFHDPKEAAEDIVQLRQLHREMDEAVAAAYGWHDLDLGHGFHETKQGLRYTICEAARREVLDRLLELNHARHAAEQVASLRMVAEPGVKYAAKKRKKGESGGQVELGL